MLDPKIQKLIDEQQKLGGVNLAKHPPGTKLLVKTKNSTYFIEKLDYEYKVMIRGGKYFPELTEARIVGSTFGGSMIQLGWLGYHMHMEIVSKIGTVTTTYLRKIKVIGPDWKYTLEWPQTVSSKNNLRIKSGQ